MRRFFILKGVQRARERREKLSKFQETMQNLFLLQTMGVDVTEDLQELKSQQASVFVSVASKIIFWHIVEQDETCSRFFFQKVHKESSVLSSLKEEDGSITSSQSDIPSKSFYASLYDRKPTDSVVSQSLLSSLTEVLDDSTREKLNQLLSLDELAKTLNMLLAGRMCESMRKGTITLVYKRKGEREEIKNWRPIPLLNPDYKILSKVIANWVRYLKVLGIWLGGTGVCAKSWEEGIAKVKQQLVLWEHQSLSIAVTQAIFYFIWKPKIDSTYKTLDTGGTNVSSVSLIRMATFVCGCIKLCVDPRYANTKGHYVLRFHLSPVLQKMGPASLLQRAPSSWTIPYHVSFVEQFATKNTIDHKSIRKWSARSVLKTLRGKERVDPVAWFPEQIVKGIWQNASSPELSNKLQDIAWLMNKELTLSECYRLAHSKVQDYMLRDTLKLGTATAK
eukprot:g34342.t1